METGLGEFGKGHPRHLVGRRTYNGSLAVQKELEEFVRFGNLAKPIRGESQVILRRSLVQMGIEARPPALQRTLHGSKVTGEVGRVRVVRVRLAG